MIATSPLGALGLASVGEIVGSIRGLLAAPG